MLPTDIINKILLYNESREAVIIKKYWRDLDQCIDIYTDLISYPMFAVDIAGNDVPCGYYSEIVTLDYPRRHFLPNF